MLIRDMHIAVQVKLNKVNSNLYDVLTPQEVDYYLNVNIERFVKQRYSPKSNLKQEGTEMTEKRIDDLRTLLVPYYADTAYVVPGQDTDKVRFSFPADYWLLMSNRSKVAYDVCNRAITHTTKTTTVNYYVVPFLNYWTTANEGLFLGNFFDLAAYNGTYSSIVDYEQADTYLIPEDMGQQVVKYIIDKTNSSDNYKAYWERYKELYYPNSFIIVYSGPNPAPTKIAPTWSPLSANTPECALQTTTLTSYKPTGSYSRMIRPNKFFQQDDIYVSFMDPFNTYSAWGPPCIITENYIDVFFDDKYVVEEVVISYFRKPATVSLSANISCDLAEHTHEEIIDMTVQYLLENLESQRFQTQKDIVNTDE